MPDAEWTEADLRLGELIESFEELRTTDPSIGVGALREEARDLFDDLVDAVEGRTIVEAGLDDASEHIPASIGGYTIHAKLGAGVSAVVYAARDREGREVALKVMHDSLALSPDGLRRFQREIEVARRLDHPHVVRVLDSGSAGSRLYLAMERVDGSTLSDVIGNLKGQPGQEWLARLDAYGVAPAGGTSPAERYARRVAHLFAPVADALEHASERGLIHRDLKPGNLMLDRTGKLRILDFGLAKMVDEEMTTTTAILGTPAYMSPEQAAGRSRDVDARTDIYGLGATLYTVLTGRYPLEAESFSEVISAILTRRPDPITSFSPDYPAGLARLISRCLEKQPSDRFPNHAALTDDLMRVAKGQAPRIGAVPFQRRARRYVSRHRVPVLAAAGLLVALCMIAAGAAFRPAVLQVSCHPHGEIFIDGESRGQTPFSGAVARGRREVVIKRDLFRPEHQVLDVGAGDRLVVVINLRPQDPFDRRALALLSESYGLSARLPSGEPVRARGTGEEVGDRLKQREPDALAKELEKFDDRIRNQPHIRLLAAAALLDRGLYAEAFDAADSLAQEHPGEVEPLRLALRALDRLRLTATPVYKDVYGRYVRAKRG